MKTIYIDVEFKEPEKELEQQLKREGARNIQIRRGYNGELDVRYTISVGNPKKDVENILNQSGAKNIRSSSNYHGARYEIRVDDIIDATTYKRNVIEKLRRAGYRAN